MRESIDRASLSLLLGAACLFGAVVGPAQAADSSSWDTDTRSQVRLVAARTLTQSGVMVMRAGVEIKLQDGWKTYWRYPGDSGVPPQLDFGSSENVKTVTVLWPAPERFADGGGYSIGYRNSVILPLRILPRDDKRPVVLRLHLDYAVCEKLCVPAKANLELPLMSSAGFTDSLLTAAEARVPKPARIGAGQSDGQSLGISSIQRMASAPRARYLVDVVSPKSSMVDLFAEGPTPRWALPLPEPLPGTQGSHKRFGFDLDGVPPDAKPAGSILKLTAVSKGGQAIEVEYRLD